MPEHIDPNEIESQFAGETVERNSNYSPDQQSQLDEIKRKRQEKFAKMGVQTIPQQRIVESASSSSYGGNGSVNNLNARDRINAIRQGLMKGKMKELQEAKSPNEKANDDNWMERDMRKKQQESKRKAQGGESTLRTPEMIKEGNTVKNSAYKSSSEADNIESMFTGGGSGPSMVGDAGADAYFDRKRQEIATSQGQQPQQPQEQRMINESSFGGEAGNWEESFRAKKQGWGQPSQSEGSHPQVIQEQRIPNQNHQQQAPQNNQPMDLYEINKLIEKTVEKTVNRKVKGMLSEFYSEMDNKKNSLTYKRVKGKSSQEIIKDVIMIEGKYFKITELNK